MNYEEWLVGVWDGMRWDGSHQFQCKLNSSHQNPTNYSIWSYSTKMPKKTQTCLHRLYVFPTVGGIGSILFNWKSCDEISTEPLAGSNISKGREFSAKFSKFSFILRGGYSLLFGEKLKSLSSLEDFPREDNFRKFSL